MEHPKDVGDRSTIAIMLALQAEGYAVLLQFGETRATTSSSTTASLSLASSARRDGFAKARSCSP